MSMTPVDTSRPHILHLGSNILLVGGPIVAIGCTMIFLHPIFKSLVGVGGPLFLEQSYNFWSQSFQLELELLRALPEAGHDCPVLLELVGEGYSVLGGEPFT